ICRPLWICHGPVLEHVLTRQECLLDQTELQRFEERKYFFEATDRFTILFEQFCVKAGHFPALVWSK
ncbi:hypothetical protein J6590_024954, partial [Homalodisca vitripennis]